jgi:hypothetical protein
MGTTAAFFHHEHLWLWVPAQGRDDVLKVLSKTNKGRIIDPAFIL